jgi:DNA-directed RNA polymerase subunit RPC12/RpoP
VSELQEETLPVACPKCGNERGYRLPKDNALELPVFQCQRCGSVLSGERLYELVLLYLHVLKGKLESMEKEQEEMEQTINSLLGSSSYPDCTHACKNATLECKWHCKPEWRGLADKETRKDE